MPGSTLRRDVLKKPFYSCCVLVIVVVDNSDFCRHSVACLAAIPAVTYAYNECY